MDEQVNQTSSDESACRKSRVPTTHQVLWVISILLATALTMSGMHAKNAAELHHSEAGLYRLMPGIILGLVSGFLLDSRLDCDDCGECDGLSHRVQGSPLVVP